MVGILNSFDMNRFVSNTGGIVGATVAVVKYQAGGSITFGGTAGSTAPMPTGGIRQIISLLVAIMPGQSLVFRVDGGGQNINQAARIGVTLVWHEEAI